MSEMTRKDFFKLVVGGAAVATLAACKSDPVVVVDAGPDAPAGCGVTDAVTTILDNHSHAPHVLVVSIADVAAGVDKTYDIMGMANHSHSITITADQFAMLKAGGMIMDTSTVAVCHTHVCKVSCG